MLGRMIGASLLERATYPWELKNIVGHAASGVGSLIAKPLPLGLNSNSVYVPYNI
jgi:hypothetical protein